MSRTRNVASIYIFIGGVVFAVKAPLDDVHAKSDVILYAFQGGSDGAEPRADLIADGAGNLYGTTSIGGGATACAYGCGTAFKLAPDGTETVLHAFQGESDGISPSGLIADKAGNFYGTTFGGGNGNGNGCFGGGCGIVFKLVLDGTETILYNFQGGNDGALAGANLLADKSGKFYGTTTEGGSSGCGGVGCGTIFKLAPDGTETILYAFQGGNDGSVPEAGLIADAAGNFYGTTYQGGGGNACDGGCGTVFELAPDGTETILHAFHGGKNDGAYPLASLIADNVGDLYGTARGGDGGGKGCEIGCGIVFKMAPDGTETVLHAFRPSMDHGAIPDTGLIEDKIGNLYGSAEPVSRCCGAVFKIAPDGTETVLHVFRGGSDGIEPNGLIVNTGDLYGTTFSGGNFGWGTVFSLKR